MAYRYSKARVKLNKNRAKLAAGGGAKVQRACDAIREHLKDAKDFWNDPVHDDRSMVAIEKANAMVRSLRTKYGKSCGPKTMAAVEKWSTRSRKRWE